MSKARNISALSTVEVGATADQTKADLNAIGVSGGRKNLIINGGFDVAQRGTSLSGTKYTLDRFTTWGDNTTSSQQTINTSGINKAIRLTKDADSTAYSIYSIDQRIEDGLERLTGKAITLSFYVRASKALTATIATAGTAWAGQNNLESGVSTSITTAWQKVSHTFTFTTASTGKLYVCPLWALNSVMSAGDWIEIAQVQLELGSVATDFEHRSYGEELALCQRYYKRISSTSYESMGFHGAGHNSSSGQMFGNFYPEMRSTPSVVQSNLGLSTTGGTLYSLTGISIANTNSQSFRLVCNTSGISAGSFYFLRGASGAGYLEFDAEL